MKYKHLFNSRIFVSGLDASCNECTVLGLASPAHRGESCPCKIQPMHLVIHYSSWF